MYSLLDQAPDNPWRVDPDVIPLMIPALTDQEHLYA